jgi:hypothetical protein
VRLYACEQFVAADVFVDDDKCACELDPVTDAALIEQVIDSASDIMYVLSEGRITGICTKTVRPYGGVGCAPIGFWGSVQNGRDASEFGWTQHRGVSVIPLRGPRTDIVEVLIDGDVVPASEYGLLDNSFFYFKTLGMPTSQDLTKAISEDGTFEITFRFGNPIDYVTTQGAIELACELALEAVGKESRLPKGTTGANIQGASVSLAEMDDDDREGLPRLSRWLNVYVPRQRERSAVWSPGWELVEVEGPSGS